MNTPKYLEGLLRQEGRSFGDLGSTSLSYLVDDSLSPNIASSVKYDNWKAISYAKKYCGLEDNACRVFLNEPGKTDCAHFVAHCLHAGGITIKTADPTANFCPWGLAVRNTDIVAGCKVPVN